MGADAVIVVVTAPLRERRTVRMSETLAARARLSRPAQDVEGPRPMKLDLLGGAA